MSQSRRLRRWSALRAEFPPSSAGRAGMKPASRSPSASATAPSTSLSSWVRYTVAPLAEDGTCGGSRGIAARCSTTNWTNLICECRPPTCLLVGAPVHVGYFAGELRHPVDRACLHHLPRPAIRRAPRSGDGRQLNLGALPLINSPAYAPARSNWSDTIGAAPSGVNPVRSPKRWTDNSAWESAASIYATALEPWIGSSLSGSGTTLWPRPVSSSSNTK